MLYVCFICEIPSMNQASSMLTTPCIKHALCMYTVQRCMLRTSGSRTVFINNYLVLNISTYLKNRHIKKKIKLLFNLAVSVGIMLYMRVVVVKQCMSAR